MDERVSRLKTPEECGQFILNVQAQLPDLAGEARRRAGELRAASTDAAMRTFFKVIGWGLLGSLSALTLTFIGLYIFNALVPRSGSDENGAWGWGDFGLLVMSPWIGFVPGGLFGIVRACKGKGAERTP